MPRPRNGLIQGTSRGDPVALAQSSQGLRVHLCLDRGASPREGKGVIRRRGQPEPAGREALRTAWELEGK
jgi:hypothetical protein